jgi:hypothetical protein
MGGQTLRWNGLIKACLEVDDDDDVGSWLGLKKNQERSEGSSPRQRFAPG